MLDFDRKEENITAGEQAGSEAVPQLRALIERVAAVKRAQLR
jgi:hypothetical protein